MQKTQPIKDKKDIQRFKQYYLDRHQVRNYALFTLGVNTSLRIGDLLMLTWGDVYDFNCKRYREHIRITEQKTRKYTQIALNTEAVKALSLLMGTVAKPDPEQYIFQSRQGHNRHIDRTQAFHIIRDAAENLSMIGTISCHSLRKTFGYHAWRDGVPPALIMSIYNHSSLEITKRYLSIDQDDKDMVFLNLNL